MAITKERMEKAQKGEEKIQFNELRMYVKFHQLSQSANPTKEELMDVVFRHLNGSETETVALPVPVVVEPVVVEPVVVVEEVKALSVPETVLETVTKKGRGRPELMPIQDFINIVESAKDLDEASKILREYFTKTGIEGPSQELSGYITTRAANLRHKGHEIKTFKRGRKLGQVATAMSVAAG